MAEDLGRRLLAEVREERLDDVSSISQALLNSPTSDEKY